MPVESPEEMEDEADLFLEQVEQESATVVAASEKEASDNPSQKKDDEMALANDESAVFVVSRGEANEAEKQLDATTAWSSSHRRDATTDSDFAPYKCQVYSHSMLQHHLKQDEQYPPLFTQDVGCLLLASTIAA